MYATLVASGSRKYNKDYLQVQTELKIFTEGHQFTRCQTVMMPKVNIYDVLSHKRCFFLLWLEMQSAGEKMKLE